MARDKKDPQLESRFTYHSPKEDQPERYVAIREKCKELAYLIVDLTPFCDEQARALDQLDIVMMLSNAAIARHE